jgi:hypothetical protein
MNIIFEWPIHSKSAIFRHSRNLPSTSRFYFFTDNGNRRKSSFGGPEFSSANAAFQVDSGRISLPCFFPDLPSVGKSLIVSYDLSSAAKRMDFSGGPARICGLVHKEMPKTQAESLVMAHRPFKISVMRFVGILKLCATSGVLISSFSSWSAKMLAGMDSSAHHALSLIDDLRSPH